MILSEISVCFAAIGPAQHFKLYEGQPGLLGKILKAGEDWLNPCEHPIVGYVKDVRKIREVYHA